MAEGYLLIATGQTKYIDLAYKCCRSLRLFDPMRPVQLVTDLTLDVRQSNLFDEVTRVVVDPEFSGPAVKLLMRDYSMFDKTMFVDVDCLLLRNDVNAFWELLDGCPISVPGNRRTSGKWYERRIEDMMLSFDAPYLWQMNSGVFYFDASSQSYDAFQVAKELISQKGADFRGLHHGGIADEPFLAAAMGKLGLVGIPVHDRNGKALMVSTIGATKHVVDGISYTFEKSGRSFSPTFAHFIGLRPSSIYETLCKSIASELDAKLS